MTAKYSDLYVTSFHVLNQFRQYVLNSKELTVKVKPNGGIAFS